MPMTHPKRRVVQSSPKDSSATSSNATGDDDRQKKSKNLTMGKLCLMLTSVALVMFGMESYQPGFLRDLLQKDVLSDMGLQTSTSSHLRQAKEEQNIGDIFRSLQRLDHCEVSFSISSNSEQESGKTVWVPGYPNSGAHGQGQKDMFSNVAKLLTGLPRGPRSWYMSSRLARKCKGNGPVVTCTTVHPIVTSGTPETATDYYFSSYILPIRNPWTTFPANFAGKAIEYHNQVGQVPEEKWREYRDEWLQEIMDAWKNLIVTWKQMKGYHVALYFQYEKFMHPQEGPDMVRAVANVLRDAGFNVAPDSDIPCIWYQTVKPRWKEEGEFYKYTPTYTAEQKDLLLQGLESFIQGEAADDSQLVAILKEYQEDIRRKTKLDIPTKA